MPKPRPRPAHPVATWRLQHNMTQLECATAWEVSVGYLAQIETYQCRPGAETIQKIRHHTGIDAEALLDVELTPRLSLRKRTRKPTRTHRHAARTPRKRKAT